jgi:hypothetical protein
MTGLRRGEADTRWGFAKRRSPDGSVTEIPPERCPNGHRLRYPNVIVAHRPKPGSGELMRCWHCLACKATIYDE